MAYGKLSALELADAIENTREAIRCAEELLEIGSQEPVTKGLEKVADELPSLLEKLSDDLKRLEKAREKGAESESDDEDHEGDDEEDEDEDEDEDDEDKD